MKRRRLDSRYSLAELSGERASLGYSGRVMAKLVSPSRNCTSFWTGGKCCTSFWVGPVKNRLCWTSVLCCLFVCCRLLNRSEEQPAPSVRTAPAHHCWRMAASGTGNRPRVQHRRRNPRDSCCRERSEGTQGIPGPLALHCSQGQSLGRKIRLSLQAHSAAERGVCSSQEQPFSLRNRRLSIRPSEHPHCALSIRDMEAARKLEPLAAWNTLVLLPHQRSWRQSRDVGA